MRAPILSDLVAAGQRLDISCGCGRRVLMDPVEAVKKFGSRTGFADIEDRLVCSACGTRGRDRRGISARPCIEDHYAGMRGKGWGVG